MKTASVYATIKSVGPGNYISHNASLKEVPAPLEHMTCAPVSHNNIQAFRCSAANLVA